VRITIDGNDGSSIVTVAGTAPTGTAQAVERRLADRGYVVRMQIHECDSGGDGDETCFLMGRREDVDDLIGRLRLNRLNIRLVGHGRIAALPLEDLLADQPVSNHADTASRRSSGR
jgi:hypothetical protein